MVLLDGLGLFVSFGCLWQALERQQLELQAQGADNARLPLRMQQEQQLGGASQPAFSSASSSKGVGAQQYDADALAQQLERSQQELRAALAAAAEAQQEARKLRRQLSTRWGSSNQACLRAAQGTCIGCTSASVVGGNHVGCCWSWGQEGVEILGPRALSPTCERTMLALRATVLRYLSDWFWTRTGWAGMLQTTMHAITSCALTVLQATPTA